MPSLVPEKFNSKRLVATAWNDFLVHPDTRVHLERELDELLTPAVLEHLPPSLQIGPDGTAGWIDKLVEDAMVLLVRDRVDQKLLGVLILAQPTSTARDIHLGYLLGQAAWGQGLASELITALVRVMTGADCRLIGGVVKANRASAKVLEKSGFKLDATLSDQDTDMFVLNLEGPDE